MKEKKGGNQSLARPILFQTVYDGNKILLLCCLGFQQKARHEKSGPKVIIGRGKSEQEALACF